MPLNRRRSRWRRALGRGVPRLLVPAVAAGLVVALLAGGASQVGRESGSYRRTVDRGYVALADGVARRSQLTAIALGAALRDAPSLDRLVLFARLDRLAADAAHEDGDFRALTPPSPATAGAAGCAAAMAQRSAAVSAVRSALEGELGGRTGAGPTGPGPASASLGPAAGELVAADASWSSCRGALRRAPGTPLLIASRWVTDSGPWDSGSLTGIADAVARSPSLATRHALALAAVSTVPTSLAAGAGGVLPPTGQLVVHATVTNQGNVDEPAVAVTVALAPGTPGPPPPPLTAITAVGAQRSVTVVLGPFPVQPGTSYRIDIAAAPPQGQGGASTTVPVQIAQVPPTTTTTSTTAPPSRRTPKRSAGGG